MNIWIIDHYAVPPKYYPLARQTIFAKKLNEKGHTTTIFCASTVHNSDKNLSNGAKLYREEVVDGVRYVFITCKGYKGNGISRVLNMLEFARKLPKVCKHYEKPDSVLACSMTLQACAKGIKLAKKYGARAVSQITDLWPEALVAYDMAGENSLPVRYLRVVEKWIYKKSDYVVVSAAGVYRYVVDRGWNKEIPEEKFVYINNGIDLKTFDFNKEHFKIDDDELEDNSFYNVIYTGSIRQVNDVGGILNVAKYIKDPKVRFLIWGNGDQLEELKQRVIDEKITNVHFKGSVEKKYVPYITSKAYLNYAHNQPCKMFRYGISFNKIFDYMAAGRPILCDFPCPFNPVLLSDAGISVDSAIPEDIASQIEAFTKMGPDEYKIYCTKARNAAEEYDFEALTQKLLKVLS